MPHDRLLRFCWLIFLAGMLPVALPALGQESVGRAETPAAIAALGLSPEKNSALTHALNSHDYPVAEKLLLDEINLDPHSQRSGRLLSLLGRVYFLDKNYLNAAIAWKKSEAIAPLDPSAKFSLAMVYVEMGHPAWAEPLLQSLAKEDAKQALYPYWLGRLDYQAQHYDAAIAYFQKAISLDPGMARAYDNLGLCYFYQNLNTQALENYAKAIQLEKGSAHPSAWPHLNMAITLKFLGRNEEAEKELREAVRLNPELAQAQYQLGTVLEAEGHLDGAIAAFEEASRLDVNYAEPHYELARIYRKQGKAAAAKAEVDAYLKLHTAAHPSADPLVH
jgi:tetratricopeptide (TPR) repeat protein